MPQADEEAVFEGLFRAGPKLPEHAGFPHRSPSGFASKVIA